MADTTEIQDKQVQLTHNRQYEFFSDEVPGYPEGLDINPSSYYIYLPKDQLHPVTEVAGGPQAPSIPDPVPQVEIDPDPTLDETPSDLQDQLQSEENING